MINITPEEMNSFIDNTNNFHSTKESLKHILIEGRVLANGEKIHTIEEYIDKIIPVLKPDIRSEDTISNIINSFNSNFKTSQITKTDGELSLLVAHAELFVLHGLYPISIAKIVADVKNNIPSYFVNID